MDNDAVNEVVQMADDLRALRGEPMAGYSARHDEAQVRESFRRRYGEEPEHCFLAGPIWLAGPKPKR